MASWVTRGHTVRQVGGSNPDRGTIVGVFHRTRQPERFSSLNMSSISNYEFVWICPRRKAVTYIPYGSPLFEIAIHVKYMPLLLLLLLLLVLLLLLLLTYLLTD